ncbi:related to cysteine-rich protein NFX-1 [Fusarium fujikuroi IMI 58289]|uniref:Related to cysteine-rich protein NFX-1 n=1 Tax=Gibberella fujikuroi (strain CBS 195.34 / IMI 58289 / NRRL A-6831) TaxID=1279085 RepID=S0DZ98_GIBF5|nr:related to cysteine-rich protein NFX-1 [Fusarium fujikuroi IMI 58289]CCT65803.1 related to cysteine-rich protein NFX-1 [Fusarium fujikuroi IMI 58289]
MAEQETSRTSHQARNNAPNRSQSEGQGSASRSRGGSGGGRRRGRGGRNRGQRQDDSAQVPEGRGIAPQTGPADATIAAPTIAAPESSGSSRGRRNRRGNRGGSRGQGNQGRGVFSMGPQRTFGGRLTTTEQPTEIAQDASLSADAPEFVPGQPVSQRSAQQHPSSAPQPTGQGRSRNRTRNRKQDRPRQEVPKSSASELWQRIQEDIANWNYECRICTEEVTRKTEVWSCTTCWTVVHLECAHQWWDTSMKVNEESGDKSWRCPGSQSEQHFASSFMWANMFQAQIDMLPPMHSSMSSWPMSSVHRIPITTTGGVVESVAAIFYLVVSMNVLKHAIQVSAVPARCRSKPSAIVDECKRRCYVPNRKTYAIRSISPAIPGLRAPLAARVLAEEPSIVGYIVARFLVTRKKRSRLIALSLRTLSPIALVARHRSRNSWRSPVKPVKIMFLTVRGFARRSWNAVISANPCATLGSATLAPKRWRLTAAAAESRVRRSAMREMSNIPYVSRYARLLATAEGIDAESIVAPVKRRHLNVLLSRRSNAWALICYQLRPSISVSPSADDHLSVAVTFVSNSATAELVKAVPRPSGKKFRAIAARQSCIRHNHAERDSHLAPISASGRLHVGILLLTISAILMMYPARRAHTSFRSDASVERRPFTTSLVICKRLIAESNAGKNSPAGSIHVKSYVTAPENAETLKTVASKYAESPSCYVITHARASAMGKLPVKNQQLCLASTSNPTPSRPDIRCDEECERLDRNRRLAAALNIDPASHTNDHIPFSDNTLKLYKQMQSWGDAQESQFRVFAANKDEVRLRYEPMKNQSRQFLHLLAEDFGFESKSEDYDIHRSVLVWKSDKFVSAPTKTLAQCVKIRATQAAEAAAAAAIRPPSPPILETEPFNALVLTEPRFGLTIEEVNAALEPDLTSMQGFRFKVDFLNEEVLIKASVSYSAFLTPAPMEKSLEILKPRIEQTIRREKLAESVLLCHSDANGAISRREVTLRAGTGGWSAVAGRAASRPMSSSSTPAPEEAKPGRKLLLGLKKKRPQQPEGGKVWAALDGDVEC